MNDTQNTLRILGALGGAVFAVLTLLAYTMNAGPSSSDGVTVVEYYTSHGSTTLWGAALVGVAMIGFIWFAETFAGWTSSRSEEHTSELQSLRHLVCRLLLEK